MRKLINIILLLILVVSSIINVVLVNRLDKSIDAILETKLSNYETVDTVFFNSLVFDTVYITKTEIIKLPIYNTDTVKQTDTLTLVEIDSVDVVVPIELKQFNDTLSNIAISFNLSGYNCRVDSLYLKSMKVSTIKEKALKKWGIGVGIGITYVDKFRLVPTLGISYNLFSF